MKLIIVGIVGLLSSAAFAQSPPPAQFSVNGAIEKIDQSTLIIRDDAGAIQNYGLSPNLLVLRNRVIELSAIQPNDFVASAAIRGQDGKLHSTELRVFPDALRGVGEGQRPMNDARNQTMTNATVSGTAVVNGSNNIKVTFEGGKQSELVLDPGVPVIRIEQVVREDLQPGQKVRVQGAGGNLATRVTIQ